jgi:putative ABC transport system permease protein
VTRFAKQPSLRGRITKVKGVPAAKVKVDPRVAWALRGERGISFAKTPPPGTRMAGGAWWPPDYSGPPIISFDARIADGLGIGLGDSISVSILGREVTAKVVNLRVIDWASLRLNHAIIFAPGVIEKAPHAYVATAHAGAEHEAQLFDLVSRRFPQVVAVHVRQVLGEVARLVGTVGLAVRAAALITLFTGLLVMGHALRASLHQRRFESVVFKVLGATRGDVLTTLAAELILQALAVAWWPPYWALWGPGGSWSISSWANGSGCPSPWCG